MKKTKRLLYRLIVFAVVVASLLVVTPISPASVLPLGRPSTVYAAPDIESLWSESNSAPNLTPTDPTYANGSTTGNWAAASGKWAKDHYWWEFVIGDSTATGIINSVTLYLKHYQSRWDNDDFSIQISDGSTWIDVESYSSANPPPTGDTTDSWDVKALGIDTRTEINNAKVRIYGKAQVKGEDTVDWSVDTVELRVDYTPSATDITNTPSYYDFGPVSEGGTYDTALTYFTVTNNSAFAVNITISGTDMTGGDTWTLSDTATPETNIYGLKAGLEGGDYTIVVKKNGPYNFLVTGLAASASTQKWGLQLLAPQTFTDGGSKSGTVTLTATQA